MVDTHHIGVNGSCHFINAFGDTQYDGKCSFFEGNPTLPQGIGWFIVCGLGLAFSLFTSTMMWVSNRYGSERSKTGGGPTTTTDASHGEDYATAGGSIKAGLTACDIVSKWTWAATLLQSSNVAFKYGISGPFWYASGATVQVLLFSVLAVEIKRKAPKSHTVLEIIHTRWGTTAHIVFMCFCFMTNLIVTAMLILGGATVIYALTGVNVYAAAFLIPVSTIFYTAHGGIKATFLAGWAHVAIIYAALCVFMFKIYANDDQLGSPGKVWDRLTVIQKLYPVSGNLEGSYLTMLSRSGFIFGIINIIGNFGTVFVDQSYWQSAIAAQPSATYKGYLLGGLCWFAIPFSMATTLGLAARAYNLPLTIAESNFGLVAPAVAVHTLGSSGAFLITFQLFMAVTSSAAAEQIAVSTLIAYDVYRRYIHPTATTKQLVRVSRFGVVFYGIFSGVLAIILFRLEISLGWLYLAMGNFIGSGVFPIAFSITWRQCSAAGAIGGAVGGLTCSILTWVYVCAKQNDGKVTIDTLGQDIPMLSGNLTALIVSPVICVVVSLIRPQNFDWEVMVHSCGKAPVSRRQMREMQKQQAAKLQGHEDEERAKQHKSTAVVVTIPATDPPQPQYPQPPPTTATPTEHHSHHSHLHLHPTFEHISSGFTEVFSPIATALVEQFPFEIPTTNDDDISSDDDDEGDDDDTAALTTTGNNNNNHNKSNNNNTKQKKKLKKYKKRSKSTTATATATADGDDDEKALAQVLSWTYRTGGTLTVVLVVLWPALTVPAKVFSRLYFGWWVSLAIIWGLVASIICVFLPVWDARQVLATICYNVFGGGRAESSSGTEDGQKDEKPRSRVAQ